MEFSLSFVWSALLIVAASVVWWMNKKPIHGDRTHLGIVYWLKRQVFYVLLKRQRRKTNPDRTVHGAKERIYGTGLKEFAELEKCQTVSETEKAYDGIWMQGFDYLGNIVSVNIGRCPRRLSTVQVFVDVPELGTYHHPLYPEMLLANTDVDSFSAGGLSIEMLEPMRRWRISYNGLLRKWEADSEENKDKKAVHVKFSFIWEAFTQMFNYKETDAWAMAEAVAKEKWTKEFFKGMKDSSFNTDYDQFGEMRGSLEIEGFPVKKLLMKCPRSRSYGKDHWLKNLHIYLTHMIHVEHGLTMNCSIAKSKNISHVKTGYLNYPNAVMTSITDNDLEMWDFVDEAQIPVDYSFNFWADGKKFHVQVDRSTSPTWSCYFEKSFQIHRRYTSFKVNGKKARGFVEFGHRVDSEPTREPVYSVKQLGEPNAQIITNKQKSLVLNFEEPACCSSQLVGGKGAQLAQLWSVQNELAVKIPKGFCLTLAAFQKQLESSEALQKSVKRIVTAIRDKRLEDLQSACSVCVECFAETSVCDDVTHALDSQLSQTFADCFETVSLAVRSSAAGEDGNEASSAGQMETFLGMKGRNQILDAVRKCWASAFTFQAVTYRRQHGQLIESSVGVVIQDMVSADISGVMFTADPVTGNYDLMTINTSYGLGEAVVSGKSSPDVIHISKGIDGKPVISSKTVGNKQIKFDVADIGGLKESNVLSEKSSEICITDASLLQLAQIGLQLEKFYGSPRDIEWAIKENKVYLLQARPVTSLRQESEDELLHEFDTALASDTEYLTTGNIGEMCPGVITPLTHQFVSAAAYSLDFMYCYATAKSQLPYIHRSIHVSCNQLFISMQELHHIGFHSLKSDKDFMELNMLGRILHDLKPEELLDYCGEKKNLIGKLICFLKSLQFFRTATKKTKEWEKRIKTYSLGLHCDTPEELYEDIDSHLKDFTQVWNCTIGNSGNAGIYSSIALSVLAGGKSEWTSEHYGDLAVLLSSCENVYTADVPTSMKALSEEIINSGCKEAFLFSSDEECLQILTSKEHPDIKKKYLHFLEQHGHRCIKEAEFSEKSWESDPTKLIHVIKTMLKSNSIKAHEKHHLSVKEAIDQLKTPLSKTARFLLQNIFVPKAREGVGLREWGKSLSVKMHDIFKRQYWKLADLMARYGYIPDDGLLFFFTHYEIGVLLKTRSAKLITKALRRRQILKIQKQMEFPLLNRGHPIPIQKTEKTKSVKGLKLSGMPVSIGVTEGMARVVKTLEDADSIQQGDILIVKFTDVGWTPYFPLISGLVTEMGGITSHGAVVAREYGLPCVVNIIQATDLLSTGDQVILDGKAGTIIKLGDRGTTDE